MSVVVRGRHQFEATGECVRCRRRARSGYAFRKATPEERAAWRADGLVALQARSLCTGCYGWAIDHDALADFERRNRPVAELLEDWNHLADPLKPIRSEARRLASQFGMSWRDLERSVSRAGVRSRFHGGPGERIKAAA